MELSDMEKLWKENDQKLEKSIRLNEQLLNKMNVDAVSELEKLVKICILGRNFAFIYFIISISSYIVITEIAYSIPGIIGGLLMLLSFFHHLKPTEKLRQLDYSRIPVIELQKIISEFRIHALSSGKYDYAVVGVWLLTIIPLLLHVAYGVDVYTHAKTSGWYFLISAIVIIGLFPFNKRMYKKIAEKLKLAESSLNEIIAFEKNKTDTDEVASNR